MEVTDTHAHLEDSKFKDDPAGIIQRAREKGVNRVINVGSDVATSRYSIHLSHQFPELHAACGIHPHNAARAKEGDYRAIIRLARDERMVAIGEVGLDYHYNFSPPEIQQKVFRRFIRMAQALSLPLIIHNREASVDTLSILKEEGVGIKGVMHAFSGDEGVLNEVLSLGLYISISGVITFKKSNLPLLVKKIPLERLLVETDSPYLAPHPFRGKRNEPAYLVYTLEKVAECLSLPIEETAQLTTKNARRLFNIND